MLTVCLCFISNYFVDERSRISPKRISPKGISPKGISPEGKRAARGKASKGDNSGRSARAAELETGSKKKDRGNQDKLDKEGKQMARLGYSVCFFDCVAHT